MIRNQRRFAEWLPAGFDGQFHWDFLRLAFNGTKIQPMDFDAVVERNGHKLVFETKAAGVPIQVGQSLTLTSAWKKDGFTIFHLIGKTAPELTGIATYGEWESNKDCRVGDRQPVACDAPGVLFRTRRWFCWASGEPMPSAEEWDRQLWLMDYDGQAQFGEAGSGRD